MRGGVSAISATVRSFLEADMRRLILTTVSVIALGLGSAGLTYAAGSAGSAGTAAGSNMPTTTATPQSRAIGATVSRSDIRAAQQKLREDNLYRGKIDGKLGRETRHALVQYQRRNGLHVTATLDRQTMDSLLATAAVGHGSTTPPKSAGSMKPSTTPTPSGK